MRDDYQRIIVIMFADRINMHTMSSSTKHFTFRKTIKEISSDVVLVVVHVVNSDISVFLTMPQQLRTTNETVSLFSHRVTTNRIVRYFSYSGPGLLFCVISTYTRCV